MFIPLPRVVLAPMEGVVDWVMRDVLTRIGGIDLCVTEFVRVTDRLLPVHEFYKYCPELKTGARTASGVPVLLQLLGGQPGPIGENAARAVELGAPGIDLNFGCPAKTVNRHDGGATLLKNPHRLHDVISAVKRAVPAHIQVTAKVRLGFSDKNLCLEIAQAAESGGARWLAVHARTRDEGYRPPAHWEFIAQMRESIGIPVIANGDIWDLGDFERCREVSGCDSVMMGRGLIARPDLARQALTGVAPMTWDQVLAHVIDFGDKSRDFRQEKYAVARCKQWLKSLSRNYAGAAELFERVKRMEAYAETRAAFVGTIPRPCTNAFQSL